MRAEPDHQVKWVNSWHTGHLLLCKLCLNLKKAYIQVWRSNSTLVSLLPVPFTLVAMTESLTTSAEVGINIIMDYAVLSPLSRQIVEPHQQNAMLNKLSSIHPAWLWGYIRSSWNEPVHCHVVFSVFENTCWHFLLNESTHNTVMNWFNFNTAVQFQTSSLSAWHKYVI